MQKWTNGKVFVKNENERIKIKIKFESENPKTNLFHPIVNVYPKNPTDKNCPKMKIKTKPVKSKFLVELLIKAFKTCHGGEYVVQFWDGMKIQNANFKLVMTPKPPPGTNDQCQSMKCPANSVQVGKRNQCNFDDCSGNGIRHGLIITSIVT